MSYAQESSHVGIQLRTWDFRFGASVSFPDPVQLFIACSTVHGNEASTVHGNEAGTVHGFTVHLFHVSLTLCMYICTHSL